MNFECKDKTLIGKPIGVGEQLVFKAVDKHMEEYHSSDIKEGWKNYFSSSQLRYRSLFKTNKNF